MPHETEFRAAAQRLVAEHLQRSQQLEADGRYAPLHKQRLLAADYLDTQRKLRELKEQHDGVIAAERQRREREAFGHTDPAALRAALADAEATKSPEDAETRLRRFERIGDEVGALAVMNVAAERGWETVLDAYTSSRPERAAALAALREHELASVDMQDRMFSPFRAYRPRTLPQNANLQQLGDAAATSENVFPPAEAVV